MNEQVLEVLALSDFVRDLLDLVIADVQFLQFPKSADLGGQELDGVVRDCQFFEDSDVINLVRQLGELVVVQFENPQIN